MKVHHRLTISKCHQTTHFKQCFTAADETVLKEMQHVLKENQELHESYQACNLSFFLWSGFRVSRQISQFQCKKRTSRFIGF